MQQNVGEASLRNRTSAERGNAVARTRCTGYMEQHTFKSISIGYYVVLDIVRLFVTFIECV